MCIVIHSSDPPPFLRPVNFNYLPQRGESEKLKKGGGSIFPISYLICQGLSFLHLEITLPFAKLCYAFVERLFLSATIIL